MAAQLWRWRLGHRSSIDFDFFTERPLDREKLQRKFTFLRRSTLIQDRPDTLSVLAPMADGSVKVSFFGGIDIGRAGVPDVTPDGVVEVASLLDLLATKLKVLQQRIEAKDYLDMPPSFVRAFVSKTVWKLRVPSTPRISSQRNSKALTYFEGGDC